MFVPVPSKVNGVAPPIFNKAFSGAVVVRVNVELFCAASLSVIIPPVTVTTPVLILKTPFRFLLVLFP